MASPLCGWFSHSQQSQSETRDKTTISSGDATGSQRRAATGETQDAALLNTNGLEKLFSSLVLCRNWETFYTIQ